MKTTDFSVGQELFYVPNANRGGSKLPANHVVKKIGRKWVTAGLPDSEWANERFTPETMQADGGNYSSPGSYYLSDNIYRENLADDAAWAELSEFMRYRSRPSGLKAASIRAALDKLQAETIL